MNLKKERKKFKDYVHANSVIPTGSTFNSIQINLYIAHLQQQLLQVR